MSLNDENSTEKEPIGGKDPGCQHGCQQPEFADNQFEERIERLKKSIGAQTDGDLAKALGIKQQSVAAARKRQQLPPVWITAISENYEISADWLLYGTGPMNRADVKVQLGEWTHREGRAKDDRRGIPLDEEDFQSLRNIIADVLAANPDLHKAFPKFKITPEGLANVVILFLYQYLDIKYGLDESSAKIAKSVMEKKRPTDQ